MEKNKMIFLSAQMDASLDDPGPSDIYSLGVIAKVIRAIKMDNNNVKVIVEGKTRARIIEYLTTTPYYKVLAKEIKEIEGESVETKELLKRVLTLFEDYLKLSQNANFESIIPALRDNSSDRIADIISSHLYLHLEEKQNLLETINSLERIRRLNFILENEILKIHSKKMEKNTAGGKLLSPTQAKKYFPLD
jgi:ATP-dependent Lon protease